VQVQNSASWLDFDSRLLYQDEHQFQVNLGHWFIWSAEDESQHRSIVNQIDHCAIG